MVVGWRNRLDADGLPARPAALAWAPTSPPPWRPRTCSATCAAASASSPSSTTWRWPPPASTRCCCWRTRCGGPARRSRPTAGWPTCSVDGLLEQQAGIGLPDGSAAVRQLEPGEGPAGQAVARRQPVIDLDAELAGPRCNDFRVREGLRAVVAVPLLAKERAVGALCLFRRTPVPSGPATSRCSRPSASSSAWRSTRPSSTPTSAVAPAISRPSTAWPCWSSRRRRARPPRCCARRPARWPGRSRRGRW